jgi:hypothetical protein
MELLCAIRDTDIDLVREIVADPSRDVNAKVLVPGLSVSGPSNQRGLPPQLAPAQVSIYESHALFEAARSGSVEILRLLLSREDLDVNQPAVSRCACFARLAG